jgi:NADH:ubiquinone oxidoreductase subunit 4 (subunit M)
MFIGMVQVFVRIVLCYMIAECEIKIEIGSISHMGYVILSGVSDKQHTRCAKMGGLQSAINGIFKQ